jgi:xanthine dehydrogenase accessory factor
MDGSDPNFHRLLADLLERGEPCATVQIVRVNGSIPNELGAKMLVAGNGDLVAGTVGGGQIELRAILAARDAIAEGRSRLYSAKLTEAEAGGIGMMCGGQVDCFIEVHRAAPRLVLCGAGHINLALARLSRGLGFRVTVIDDRADWANAQNYPDAEVLVRRPEDVLGELGLGTDSFVVVGTRDRDLEVIIAASRTDAGYIGVVASRRKAIQIGKHLALRDASEAVSAPPDGSHPLPRFSLERLLPRFHGPIGLLLGGRSPEAVALSILAEVQALRYGQPATPMRVPPEELLRHAERSTRAPEQDR